MIVSPMRNTALALALALALDIFKEYKLTRVINSNLYPLTAHTNQVKNSIFIT